MRHHKAADDKKDVHARCANVGHFMAITTEKVSGVVEDNHQGGYRPKVLYAEYHYWSFEL